MFRELITIDTAILLMKIANTKRTSLQVSCLQHMSAFGSSISRFPSSNLTGYGGKFKAKAGTAAARSRRVLNASEQKIVRHKLKAAAYTSKGVDWHKLFRYYDTDNSGEIGFIEFKRLLRSDAKVG